LFISKIFLIAWVIPQALDTVSINIANITREANNAKGATGVDR
jgi:hypothetical protein